MVLANVLLLSQIAGHVILVILSLCMMVPLGMSIHEFGGNCLLFTSGKWREEDGMFEAKWSSTTFCSFPLFTAIFLFSVSTFQIYRYSRMKEEASFLSLFIDVVIGIWMLAFSILSAIMVTLGFIVWCDGMTERFPSCETSAGQNIIHGDQYQIDTSGFYIEMGTAQFGAWGSFAISVGIGVIALLKLIQNHQVRNIKVSMYLERQRLVNQHHHQLEGQSTTPTVSESNTKYPYNGLQPNCKAVDGLKFDIIDLTQTVKKMRLKIIEHLITTAR